MRGKSLIAFALAIGCGLVAMVGVQQVLQKQNVDPDIDKITVYVAKEEILPGQTIDLNMLEVRKFLKGSVPPSAVTSKKKLEKRALTVKVMPGDIIREDKLGAEGKTGASISIPNGMRVVSLPTNTTQAHSGMIQPGDRVDVMVSYRVTPPAGKGREYPETKTVLGYIQVFATDAVRDANAGEDGAKNMMKNVSLLVTPQQAQVLMMAQNVGQLHLSLRNAGDTKEVDIANLTPDEFRDQVVLNGQPLDEPDPSKRDPAPATEEPEPPKDLNNFLDDAAGKKTEVAAAPAVESNTESWDIAFYGKEGIKIETLEIPRRAPVVEPKASQPTSVMGTLYNILRPSTDRKPEVQQVPADSKSATSSELKKAVEAQPTGVTRDAGTTPKAVRKTPATTTSKSTTDSSSAAAINPTATK